MGKYRRVHRDRHTAEWRTDPDLANIIEAYEADLRNQGLDDFDDLVIFGKQLASQHDWGTTSYRRTVSRAGCR